jgi:hypothetical protein
MTEPALARARQSWRAAEARLYPRAMTDVDGYQRAVVLVAAICERLRAAATTADDLLVAEAHLPTRRGINSQRLKIGKTLPDSRSAPNHNVEDFLLFVQVSDDQA